MDDVCQQYYNDFGFPGSEYQKALPLRKDGIPVKGPWLQGAIIKFLEGYKGNGCGNIRGNEDSVDQDSFCVSLPVVVRYAGNESMKAMIMKTAKLMSANSVALETTQAFARILESFIVGSPDLGVVLQQIRQDLPNVGGLINAVEGAKGKDHTAAVAEFGKTCPLPGSFQGALLALLTSDTFVGGVRKNIRAGGDNCGRSNPLGSCLGAKYGFASIPQDWLAKVTDIEQMLEMAIEVAGSS